MKILVVGAGMYVTGRQGTGTGTLLAALAESSRRLPISEVVVVARSASNQTHVAAAAQRINALLGTTLSVRYEATNAQRSLAEIVTSGEKFDCAIVSVPDHAHFEVASQLIGANVPCLVVKPLTPTLKEGRALTALVQAQRCYGAVEFHKRWDETNLYARKAIDAKMLGRLLYVSVAYSQRISIPSVVFRDWAAKTNIFQYLGVHYVDLIHFLTGFLPARAMAVGTRGILQEQGISEFDSVHATILWESVDKSQRLVSQFATNWIDPNCSSALSDQKYTIVGTKGRLELNQKDRGVEFVTQEHGIQQINPYFSEFLPEGEGRMTFSGYGHRSVERFLLDVQDLAAGRSTIEQLERLRPTFRSALPSIAVTEAVNASLANGSRWEDIGEVF